MFKVYLVDDVLHFERNGVVSGIVGRARAFTQVGLSGTELVVESEGGKRHVVSSAGEIEVEGVVYDSFDEVLSALQGFANFNRSAAETDPSSTSLWYDEENKNLVLVTNEGNYAFEACSLLRSVDLPLARSVRDNAFEGCAALQSINIPLVTSVGERAFRGCSALQSIDLPLVKVLRTRTFSNCTSLESVGLPLVSNVLDYAFYGCSSLRSVDLPLARSVRGRAFSNCTSLESVGLPLVESLGGRAFEGCAALQSIDVPRATSVSTNVFIDCTALQRIDLGNPNNDLQIGNVFTNGCPALTDINFNAKAITLMISVSFSGNPNLKKSCILQLFEKLVDNSDGTAKTITVSSNNTFTEEELAIARNKNYTVSISN